LDIHRSNFDTTEFPDNLFDVVTAWAVFEHLHNPMLAFQKVRHWLKKWGRLIILVTNIRSIVSRWTYQENISPHLYVFLESAFRRFGDAVGLRLVSVAYDSRFFGDAGRGVLGVRLFEAFGMHRLHYFRAMRLPVSKRLVAYPVLALADLPLHVIERLILPAWLVCALRYNGTIIATFEKPALQQREGE